MRSMTDALAATLCQLMRLSLPLKPTFNDQSFGRKLSTTNCRLSLAITPFLQYFLHNRSEF